MPDCHATPTTLLLYAADCVDNLVSIQDAMLGLESLLEPTFGKAESLLKIERSHLYALLTTVNTRFVLDLKTARQALQACRVGGAA